MISDRAPEQGTDLVEEVAKAIAIDHYARRFGKAENDPHVIENAKQNAALFYDSARAAIATIDRLRLAAPVWLPIETAPKDGTPILLGSQDEDGAISTVGCWVEAVDDGMDYMGHDAGFVDYNYSYYWPGRSCGNPTSYYPPRQPTHWQPPPSPPSEQAAAVAGEDAAANPGNQPKESHS